MDEEEKRALFRDLRARCAALPSAEASSASASDDIDSSATESPPASLVHPPDFVPSGVENACGPSIASSDAETIEPEDYEQSSFPTKHQASAAVTVSSVGEIEPPSPSSSAETVPPPSPGTLARYQLASDSPFPSSSTAAEPASVRPVCVAIDDVDIDAWDAQQRIEKERKEDQTHCLAGSYPKLARGKFKFAAELVEGSQAQDIYLSDKEKRDDGRNFGVLPVAIWKFLSSYQRDGITFMYRLFERGRGGLLADAMGLGKTVQTVCFLGAAFSIWDRPNREQNDNTLEDAPKILVVAPASVRENWQNEFATWTPFRTQFYDRAHEPSISRKLGHGAVDVLIAGTHLISKYVGGFFSSPCGMNRAWKWDVVIVDEIHIAKNKNTKIYEALKEIPHTVMFGLTGTAVQNRLKELWNVMSLVVPERLWPDMRSFKNDYIDVITKGTKKDASHYLKQRASERITVLRKLLAKHIVRRPKSIIESHLPGKTDYCVLMRMNRNGLQGYMYQRFQNSYDVKLLRDARRPCDCGSMEISKDCCHRFPSTEENMRDAPIWDMHHKGRGPCERCPNCICLYLQHYSRCLAAHALLIMPEDDEVDPEKSAFRRRLFKYYLGKYCNRALGPLFSLEQDADVSCKLNVALRLLKSYEASGHKTIIFYESLRLGSILQRWATNKGLIFEVIDGSVHKDDRQGAVDRFNSNAVCSVFFISKKAGGTGLNICGADRVLIFEPCWNPTIDLQAGDRAHRLGQKRVVQIIRLAVENTIEHYVFKTAISKSQVSSAILDNTKEEWHVKEHEVGTMQAMLCMGNVFTDNEMPQDEFRVVEAARLLDDDGKLAKHMRLENGSSVESSDNKAVKGDGQAQDEIDVLGDSVLCSLDVNVEDISMDVDDSFISATDRVAPQFESSQMETDIVLQEGGASNKIVMESTSARKRKRQVMGLERTRRTSGINPDGAEGVNFDDTSWSEIPPSPSRETCDGEQLRGRSHRCSSSSFRNPKVVVDKQPPVNTRKRRAPPSLPPMARQKRTKIKDKTSDIPAAPKPPKPRSAFSARARIRR
ncbi:unnamed protein product [Chondrus crispus]|uniref:Uncharacterized protein n=1 Tax=Chondrus crispus TaxID=2769 RepID=R7QA25_CHOCR|nr:unnamed protein product [Chondrus crispus]CDF35377.1 unnamed protein product [Chondrus crispus]|eukprot:XP_005715196.1 unnamed protein product [Chondrus crispus]